MAESMPDDDDLDDIDTEESDFDDDDADGGDADDDGGPDDGGADEGESDGGDAGDDDSDGDGDDADSDDDGDDADSDGDGDDDSLSDTALLAATMPMGMAARKQQPQGAVPSHPGGKPDAAAHQPGPGEKPSAGHPAGQAPGGKHPASGQPEASHPHPGQHAPKSPSGKDKPNGKGNGGKGGNPLAAAQKELATAQKAHDALQQPHDKATKTLVDSAKTLATGLKPLTDAIKKSTPEHKNAKKEHDDHEKLQGDLDKALTGGGLGFIMKLVDQLKPQIDKISDFLNRLKTSLIKAFEKALKPVADFFERVWSKVAVPAFQKAVQVVSGAFNAAGDVLRPVFASLKRACATVVRAVGEVLKDLDFTVPSWVGGGASLGLGKIGDTLIEWSTKMRNGGMVHGPGGPREDKVPVMMSNGEFVVNAVSAAKHLNLLRVINNEANGTRSTLDSGYAATAKSLPGSASSDARALTRSDRPQLVIAKPLGLAGDHLDRSLKVNISAPEIDHAYARDSAAITRKSLTYSAGRR
ncbi:hypothetical protein [Nocardia sp. NBC_01388]|uniref:hypothetical protein n=1 Tax=Nocardia sp. NBC_01388 TaxID=2903596 RepID=UPI00324949CE